MYLIMYKTLLLYKYFGNKELKLCLYVCISHKTARVVKSCPP